MKGNLRNTPIGNNLWKAAVKSPSDSKAVLGMLSEDSTFATENQSDGVKFHSLSYQNLLKRKDFCLCVHIFSKT